MFKIFRVFKLIKWFEKNKKKWVEIFYLLKSIGAYAFKAIKRFRIKKYYYKECYQLLDLRFKQEKYSRVLNIRRSQYLIFFFSLLKFKFRPGTFSMPAAIYSRKCQGS